MRRLLMLVMLVLLALPLAANAQDQEVLWELDRENFLDVTDIGFRFYYPVGWVWGSGSNGIAFASNQADLDAQLDDDDSTLPSDQVITILGIPMEALPAETQGATMDVFADFVVEVGQIAETERVEVPIMARRSISMIGENSVGRSGIATIWTQNGYLTLASVGGPDAATINKLAYTWGVTIGSIEPLNSEELGDGVLAGEAIPFTMNYPASWTADSRQPSAVVFELEDDIGQELAEFDGIGLSVVESAIADLGFAEDASLSDVATAMQTSFGLDETATTEEFVFLDQRALVFSGEIADGSGGTKGLILTISVGRDGQGVMFVLMAPSAERAVEFMPTWVKMMQSVQTTATE